jgi:hypothetical protein
MPQQTLSRKLVAGQVLSATDAAAARVEVIETVPIEPETVAP